MANGISLSDAIQKVIDNVENAAVTTGFLVSQKMKEDFEEMAKGTVDKYYEYEKGQYTKYGREYNLYKIYKVTVAPPKKTKKGVHLELNLNLNSDVLEGLYHSNASKVWQDVGADYVFNNFMGGFHPWTNGWPLTSANDLIYKEIKASPNVDKTIKKYKKNYGDKYFNDYVDKILMQLIKVYL